MKILVLAITIATAIAFIGCKQTSPGQFADSRAPETKLTEWSWLQNSGKHDAEIAQIPKDAEFDLFIPEKEPLVTTSFGWGWVDNFFNFTPAEKKSGSVVSGTLISRIGTYEKKAKWGDWDFVDDSARIEHKGWGYSLTNGEVLLPKETFDAWI